MPKSTKSRDPPSDVRPPKRLLTLISIPSKMLRLKLAVQLVVFKLSSHRSKKWKEENKRRSRGEKRNSKRQPDLPRQITTKPKRHACKISLSQSWVWAIQPIPKTLPQASKRISWFLLETIEALLNTHINVLQIVPELISTVQPHRNWLKTLVQDLTKLGEVISLSKWAWVLVSLMRPWPMSKFKWKTMTDFLLMANQWTAMTLPSRLNSWMQMNDLLAEILQAITVLLLMMTTLNFRKTTTRFLSQPLTASNWTLLNRFTTTCCIQPRVNLQSKKL